MAEQSYEQVLHFWFGVQAEVCKEYFKERNKLWFQGGIEVDREIERQYSGLVKEAACGALPEWEEDSRSTLALLILLDQFPRNIFRGMARAFFFDPIARHICLIAVARKFDLELSPIERIFFYLPLEHSEDRELQELSVAKYRQLHSDVSGESEEVFAGYLRYAEAHQDTVLQFGRFPGRNKALKRESTAEEKKFLATGRSFVGM